MSCEIVRTIQFRKDFKRTCVLTEKLENIEGVLPSVNDALQKALAKDPKDRFSSCSEFATALQIAETKKTDLAEKKAEAEAPAKRETDEEVRRYKKKQNGLEKNLNNRKLELGALKKKRRRLNARRKVQQNALGALR